jgi:hypothetical protein
VKEKLMMMMMESGTWKTEPEVQRHGICEEMDVYDASKTSAQPSCPARFLFVSDDFLRTWQPSGTQDVCYQIAGERHHYCDRYCVGCDVKLVLVVSETEPDACERETLMYTPTSMVIRVVFS